MSEEFSDREKEGAEHFASLSDEEKERVLSAYVENVKKRKSMEDDEVYYGEFEESERAFLIKEFLDRCFEEFRDDEGWDLFKRGLRWNPELSIDRGSISLIEKRFEEVRHLARRSPSGDLSVILPLREKVSDLIDLIASYSCGDLMEGEALEKLDSFLGGYEYGPWAVMESARTLVAYLIFSSVIRGDLDLLLAAKVLRGIGADRDSAKRLVRAMKRNCLRLIPLVIPYVLQYLLSILSVRAGGREGTEGPGPYIR